MMFSISKMTQRIGADFFCFCVVSLSVALILMPFSLRAQETGGGDPAAFEVQVFGEPAFSGAMRSLVLERGSSHAYFERLDDDQISAVRSLKTGAAVGIVLFRHAYFVSRDQSCAATLGSDENPDLIWTGATADFLPATRGTPAVDEMSDAGAKGYASAILFRRADGPPPGALLMKRRRSYGKGCGNILRSLNFDRRFVPMDFQTSLSNSAERAALEQGCVNLQGAKVAGKTGTDSVRLSDMLKSDRIALLQPSDLDQGYRTKDRRFHAVLFDGDNCQGESVRIDTALSSKPGARSTGSGSIRRDLLLSDFLFRDRVRSLRVVAADGAARVAAKAASPAPAADSRPLVAVTRTPNQKPKTGEDPALTERPKAERDQPARASKIAAPRAKSPNKDLALDEPKAAPIETKAALAAADETQAKVGLPTAKLEPMTELPSQPKASEGSAVAAVATAPSAQPLQPTQTSQPASPEAGKVSTPAVRFADDKKFLAERNSTPAQKPESKVSNVQTVQADAEPKPGTPEGLDPVVPGEQVFTFPVYDVYRLNYCLNAKGGCGEPAASKWCELKGFKRAVAWQKDNNIGGIFPTFLIGDRRICAQYKCDGFAEVTCGN